MDRGAWWAAVHEVAKSRTRLGNFTFTFHFPSPGDLPDLGIEPGSPALQADALLPEPPGHP